MTVDFNPLFGRLPDGWLDAEEAILLLAYASMTEGPILEVGSYKGRSSVLLASLKRPVWCVDNFADGTEEDFKKNTAKFRNIDLFGMPIEDWEPRPTEFVFLDGDHSYEGSRRQIEIALKCKPKFIAMHDISASEQGKPVTQAADELLGDFFIRAGKLAIFKVRQ